jgi:outer membrane protein OmpA-like peptidoglycan-associated protein
MSALKLKVITGILFGSLVLSGCQTYDAYTGERKTSSATKYGAIGAVVCGLIGSRNSGKHARNAALGCGIVGASIGAYMDNQEKKLRESLEATGVGIQREGDHIRLIMPGNITFATNKSIVQTDFYPVLDSVVTVLQEYDQTLVEVQGFTDSTGSWEHNMKLSEDRARQVSSYLSRSGVIEQRLITTGKGPSDPIASNDNPEGRAQNRRVEIRIRAIEA